jgi:flavin reductase (DIM6/NTAB) family NADH-FMN oxidoreductase RutF
MIDYLMGEHMSKVSIGANTFVYPMPVTLLGAMVGGKPNFMALGWLSRVNANPPLLGIGVGKHHYTIKGIEESKAFSISYPSADMMDITDYCGIVSGEKADKAGLFEVFYGELKNAPMITQCPLSMECRLVEKHEYATNTWFIGEIVGAYAHEHCLRDGKPDIKKMNPLLLTMPDNSYWTAGEYAGKAWGAGKDFKKTK